MITVFLGLVASGGTVFQYPRRLKINGAHLDQIVCIAVAVFNPLCSAAGAVFMDAGFEYTGSGAEVRKPITQVITGKDINVGIAIDAPIFHGLYNP